MDCRSTDAGCTSLVPRSTITSTTGQPEMTKPRWMPGHKVSQEPSLTYHMSAMIWFMRHMIHMMTYDSSSDRDPHEVFRMLSGLVIRAPWALG